MSYLLGIDNGGTVIKAALFDMQGNQIAVRSVKTPMETPEPGFTQRSLESVRRANYEVIRLLTREYGSDIAAVGLSGHGKGLYVLGRNREEIYPGIGSTDSRALPYEQMWKKDGTADRVYEKTAQKVLACQPVALLRWMKDKKREVYDRIGYVMSVKDYVRYCLTETINAEYSDVSGTNLLNLYTETYDDGLLQAFGIPEMASCLPPLIHSAQVSGTVTEACAKETGLKTGTPVVGGMFDIDACAIASGCIHAGDMCLIAGTWSINEYVAPVITDDKSVSMNSIFCDPRYYLAEESSATSAGNLEWFRDCMKTRDYGEIDRLVKSVSAEDCDVYYLPFLYASNENPLAKGSLIGLSGYHTQAHVFRAVYEGVAFSHMTHVAALLKTARPVRVRLTGGAVNSALWTQIISDVLGLRLEIVQDTEMGAKGAAMAAGVGAGIYKDYADAVEKCVRPFDTVTPDPEQHALYEKKYAKYRRIADALDAVWE